MPDENNSARPWQDAFAGFVAGATTTVVMHPFEVLKTRMQVDHRPIARRGYSFRLLRQIFYHEGGFSGLYRGLGPNFIGNSVSWALYFVTYDGIKAVLSQRHQQQHALAPYEYFMASGFAGAITAMMTNPIWVIKTRMLVQPRTMAGAYPSINSGFRSIWRHEGFWGFYRGLVPSLLNVTSGALQFMLYEEMKKARRKQLPSKGPRDGLATSDYVVVSSLSKLLASTATYPLQVLRSRLQFANSRQLRASIRTLLVRMWRQEGLIGFYKGLAPNLARVVPSSCVTLVVYEKIRALAS